jgi:hypothetical protein
MSVAGARPRFLRLAIAVVASQTAACQLLFPLDAAPGGVPSDAQGVAALRIADMMESFGANIYSNMQDGQSNETVEGITEATHYLVGDSGLTMLYRGYVNNPADYEVFGPNLFAATRGRFTLCMGIGDQPDPSGVVKLAQDSASHGNWIAFIEGGDEPNTNFGQYQSGVPSTTELLALQAIHDAVHPLGIPVAAASVVGDSSAIAGYWGGNLAEAVAASNLYNTHLYPNHGGPNGGNQLYDWSVAVSSADWADKGGIITEFQPVIYNQVSTTDEVAAYWTPIMLLSGYADFHLQAIVWWAMFDYASQPMKVHAGLFKDGAANPYPAAQVIRAMYALTGDRGPDKHVFTPGKLDITVSGLPTGENAYAGGRFAVFQNSSPGTFFVFVWNEQNALNLGATSHVSVSFNAAPAAKVVDYSLTNPVADNPVPIQTLTNVTSVDLDLTTEVRLLQVTHP